MNGNGPQPRHPRGRRPNSIGEATAGLWVLVVVGLLLVILLLSPVLEVAFPGRPRLTTSLGSIGRVPAITVAHIAESPSTFIGKTVTISGEVQRMVGPYAFTVGGEDFVDGQELLVLIKGQMASQRNGGHPAEHDIVQATGLVRRFDVRAAEREIGVDLPDAQFARWTGRPAIMARALSVTTRVPDVSLDNVLAAPGRFAGRVVRIRGELGELLGNHAFTLVGDAPVDRPNAPSGNLLVIVDEPLQALRRLQEAGLIPSQGSELTVTVTGTVRLPSVEALRQVLGLRLADALHEQGIGRTVLVARGVTIAADERGKQ